MANPATVDTVRPFDLADALSDLHIYLQPIVDLATGVPLAFEALARFGSLSDVPVEAVFAAGHEAGQGHELEAACLRAALRHRDALPDRARLAVNISPDVLTHPSVRRAWPADLDGVIIEVTENHAGRPGAVHRELAGLRLRGAQVAVDDADTGYAGLLRLATMNPDFVKLDRSVVTGVSRNAAQAAVLETLVTFSHRTNSVVIAEGVEALTDLTLLAGFDVDYVQGYAIGRPGAVATPIGPRVAAACRHSRYQVLQQRGFRGVARPAAPALPIAISTMATATGLSELHAALAQASDELGIDCIGVSVVDRDDGTLHEICSSGAPLDTAPYDLADYPATGQVLDAGRIIEVQLADAGADEAETRFLRAHGRASLLMIPLPGDDRPIGVLEFSSRTHRRWTTHDIALGRGLATHVSTALLRIVG